MKFPLFIIAGVLASANASVKNIKFGNRQLRRGVRTETLLKNAVPFKTRRLDGDDEDEAEIDDSYSISFGKCVDIKTKSEDLFNGNFIDQVQNGNVLSLKSYVLFYACQDAYGYGCSEDNSNVYAIDLSSYLSVVGTKEAYQRNEVCEICEENLDYCAAANEKVNDAMDDEDEEEDNEENNYADEAEEEEDNEEQDADAEEEEDNEEQDEAEEEEDNEEQKEEDQEEEDNEEQMEEEDQQEEQNENNEEEAGEEGQARKLKQQINCNMCNELQCFGKYSNDDNVVSETATRDEIDAYVGAWIEEVASCKATNEYIDGQQIYIGPICSDYADTFEIGAFLDEDCTIYTNLASYDDIVAAEESVDVAKYAINSLKAAFYEPMSCDSLEFEEDVDGDEEDEEDNEMNDYCNQLFEQDSINFNACAADDDYEEQQDEGDDAYNWYDYDLEDADELDQVCAKIVSFGGKYNNYYDSASTGSVHTRNRKGNLVYGQSTSLLSVGAIVAIVLACIFVVGVAAHLLKPKRRVRNPDLHQPVYRKKGLSRLLSPRKAPAHHAPVYPGHLD